VSRSGMAHPPRSKPPLRSSSGPPNPCITPSTETLVVVVNLMSWSPRRTTSAGPRTQPGRENPLGDDLGRLHDWMFSEKIATHAEIVDEIYASAGAVLMGKRMFDVGLEQWGDPPPFGMPVFIVTHEARERLPMGGGTTYTFVTEGIEAALELARAAAGDKDVGIWGGANIIEEYL